MIYKKSIYIYIYYIKGNRGNHEQMGKKMKDYFHISERNWRGFVGGMTGNRNFEK